MKKLLTAAVVLVLCSLPLLLPAQSPPHPNGGSSPNEGGTSNTPVGGAPIGSGGGAMVIMGVAYAVWKLVRQNRLTESRK